MFQKKLENFNILILHILRFLVIANTKFSWCSIFAYCSLFIIWRLNIQENKKKRNFWKNK